MQSSYDSPLGIITITAGDSYIESISFSGENNSTHAHSALLEKCMKQLDEYFEGTRRIFDLPILQKGTNFQEKVWQELLTIPYGKTTSYLALSKQLGDVKAIRAVGTANGRNNLAIVVPCHRVIGSNSSLTGYAGGLWRKQWLLEHEAKHANGLQLLFQ